MIMENGKFIVQGKDRCKINFILCFVSNCLILVAKQFHWCYVSKL